MTNNEFRLIVPDGFTMALDDGGFDYHEWVEVDVGKDPHKLSKETRAEFEQFVSDMEGMVDGDVEVEFDSWVMEQNVHFTINVTPVGDTDVRMMGVYMAASELLTQIAINDMGKFESVVGGVKGIVGEYGGVSEDNGAKN